MQLLQRNYQNPMRSQLLNLSHPLPQWPQSRGQNSGAGLQVHTPMIHAASKKPGEADRDPQGRPGARMPLALRRRGQLEAHQAAAVAAAAAGAMTAVATPTVTPTVERAEAIRRTHTLVAAAAGTAAAAAVAAAVAAGAAVVAVGTERRKSSEGGGGQAAAAVAARAAVAAAPVPAIDGLRLPATCPLQSRWHIVAHVIVCTLEVKTRGPHSG